MKRGTGAMESQHIKGEETSLRCRICGERMRARRALCDFCEAAIAEEWEAERVRWEAILPQPKTQGDTP